MKEPANALIESLQRAISVFDEQRRQAEAARQQAISTRQRFSRFMDAARADDTTEIRNLHRGETLSSHLSETDTLSTMTNLSLHWEEAFCDAYDALIRLSALPAARERVLQLADTLRSLRLLQYKDGEAEPATFSLPESLHQSAEDANIENPRVHRAEMAFAFMSEMDDYVAKVQQNFEEKTKRTTQLLEEALHQATLLAER